MCSDYESIENCKDLNDRFDIQNLPSAPNKKNIRPTDIALIFDVDKKLQELSWGIPLPWQDENNTNVIINARVETLAQKPSFQPILNGRCLVPATAWFEWRKVGSKKLKNRISVKGEPLFTFAGLASNSHFTIITCEAVENIAHINNRMPLVLTPDTENEWLDAQTPIEVIAKHLAPNLDCSLRFKEEKPAQSDLFT
jgi:putative SOS response-associated peptidase YedK